MQRWCSDENNAVTTDAGGCYTNRACPRVITKEGGGKRVSGRRGVGRDDEQHEWSE